MNGLGHPHANRCFAYCILITLGRANLANAREIINTICLSHYFSEKKIGQCRIATRTPEDIYDSIMTTCEQRIYAREPNEYLFLRNEYESVKNEDKEFYVLVKELKIG